MDFLNFKSKNTTKSIDDTIYEYANKSEDELMENILLEAEKAKNAGILSNKDIENFVNTISPMLNDTQKQKLNEIIRKINV